MFPMAAPWHRHHFKCPHWGSHKLSWSAGSSRSTAPAWTRWSGAAMETSWAEEHFMNRLITSNELKSRTSAIHSFRLRNRIHRMEAEENYILKYEMLKCWALICFRWKFPREWVCLIWMSDFSNLLPTQSDNLICIYPGHKKQDTIPSYPLLWVFFVDFSHNIRMNDMPCDSTSVGVYSPW